MHLTNIPQCTILLPTFLIQNGALLGLLHCGACEMGTRIGASTRTLHIEAETRWTPFRRRHFYVHFRQ